MLASKKPKAKKIAPDPTKEQVWTNDGEQKNEKSEETETKEKTASSIDDDHDGEITMPGSTVNVREDVRTDEPTTQIIESDDDDDDKRSIHSLRDVLPKDSKSRLAYVKKMLNRTKVKVLTEKDSARPMSAPGVKSLMKRKIPQRPQTAHASRAQQQKPTLTTHSSPASDEQTERKETTDSNLRQVEADMTSQQMVEDYKEVAYIPYEFAQAMILRMCRDMDEIKISHVDVMRKMEVHFKTVEEKKRQNYRELIEKIKSSHKNKVLQYRQIIAILQRTNTSTNENTDIIMKLELKNQRLEQEKQEILKRLGRSVQAPQKSEASSFQEEKEVKISNDIQQTEKEKTLEAEEKYQHDDIIMPEKLDDNSCEQPTEDRIIGDEENENITRQHEDDVIKEDSDTSDIDEEEADAPTDDLEKESNIERKYPERSVASGRQRSAVVNPEELRKTKALLLVARKEKKESQAKIQALERQLASSGTPGAPSAAGGGAEQKRLEKKIKDLEKKLETENKKVERNAKNATDTSEELKQSKKELATLEQKLKAQQAEVQQIKQAAEVGAVALQELPQLKVTIKTLEGENKELSDNYNTERILRKKYYNMVEDMKGKIRVYCRVRPLSSTEKANKNVCAVRAPDDYTIKIDGRRGTVKEFQFDQIFTDQHSQENVFEDTQRLIQSAVDGYNVCIFAYGQTGSGKTYTMIGDQAQQSPGIAPRAFKGIFDLAAEQRKKFSFNISCYMLELYNDKLIDLLKSGKGEEQRLDIKKDKKEMVYVQGAVIREAESSDELFDIFQGGSENRHIASTKMNSESSRSHLIIGIIIESTNLVTGAVTRGKLSLVDLAGSERVAKTGAGAEQLKEANSINKSLSALGDVISALSTEQSFVPFRNNKLTMLMQDSLGGNAKTLMFVNISPADYNSDESIISLTYASRVKLITNNATKNADSKEVARLKQIIAKLKEGEDVDDYE